MARKRKADATPTAGEAKRARIEPDQVTDKPETNPNERPKRTSIDNEITVTSSVPKKRGRPAKATTGTTATATPLKRPRGRPPLSSTTRGSTTKQAKVESPSTPPRKRGRPSSKSQSDPREASAAQKLTKKAAKPASKAIVKPVKRGPGRPPKGTHTLSSPIISQPHEDLSIAKRGRGRPSKTPRSSLVQAPRESDADGNDHKETHEDENDGGHQYWLMKAEPNDRFEKGHNVKFSIDDLAAAAEPEPWDGVRNPVARNNMRSMRKGDLAFFYHSNCPAPAIVGIMRIVQEHTVDQSAFDPKHPYYDPKSKRETPKWDVVHVEFVKKFDQQVTLKMLTEVAATTGELLNMQVIKTKRLSVTSVRPKEWEHVLSMADEDPDVGRMDASDKTPGMNEDYVSESTNGISNDLPENGINGGHSGNHEPTESVDNSVDSGGNAEA